MDVGTRYTNDRAEGKILANKLAMEMIKCERKHFVGSSSSETDCEHSAAQAKITVVRLFQLKKWKKQPKKRGEEAARLTNKKREEIEQALLHGSGMEIQWQKTTLEWNCSSSKGDRRKEGKKVW